LLLDQQGPPFTAPVTSPDDQVRLQPAWDMHTI
jgi:hypothetical protein